MTSTIYGVRLESHKPEYDRWFREDPEGAVEWALRQASLESPWCGCAIITLVRSGRIIAGFFRDEKNE